MPGLDPILGNRGGAFCVLNSASENGAPGTTRTYDPQLRKLVLYPTELRARKLS